MINFKYRKSKILFFFLGTFLLAGLVVIAQQAPTASKDYFTIESYYKVKWGHAAEFISL